MTIDPQASTTPSLFPVGKAEGWTANPTTQGAGPGDVVSLREWGCRCNGQWPLFATNPGLWLLAVIISTEAIGRFFDIQKQAWLGLLALNSRGHWHAALAVKPGL